MAVNVLIATTKGIGTWITHSGAMLAECIHSLADCAKQALLLVGLRRARRPPSTEGPLGYGKEVYFGSFIVAILLFSIGGLCSVYEGWHKIQHPGTLHSPWLGVGILAFAVIAEGLSLVSCFREVDKERLGRELWQCFGEPAAANCWWYLGKTWPL